MGEMMIEVKAPNAYELNKTSIFLAGSIEMGAAVDWQSYIKEKLDKFDVLLLNPRRDEWDNSWEQIIQNKKFKEQVEWELTALESADYIIIHFEPDTKSPISLLELGLFKDKKVMVSCPKG